MLELHRRHKTSVVLHNMNYIRHKYKQGETRKAGMGQERS